MDSPRLLLPQFLWRREMRKLVTMLLFLAITGLTTACGALPTDLADECPEGTGDPNGFCEGG